MEEQAEVKRKQAEEEERRQVATAVKVERLTARRTTLNEAYWTAMLEFCVKTLS
jgi:hypothetical protein